MEMGKFVQGGGMSKYRDSSQGLTSSKECKGDLCNGERWFGNSMIIWVEGPKTSKDQIESNKLAI